MDEPLGRVSSVAGSHMTVAVEAGHQRDDAARIGAMVKVRSEERDVVGTVSAVQVERDSEAQPLLQVDLMGEILYTGGNAAFSRGVARYPGFGFPVLPASDEDLGVIYARPSRSNVRIGTLYHDPAQPAYVTVDDLLGRHFAVLGSTGSGKSCGVTVILSAILAEHPNAHVILLDPHNEYSTVFGDIADVVNVDNLRLPFWLFNLEEAVRILVRGGTSHDQESQANILKDGVLWARRHFTGEGGASASITVDTPVPFRIFDLLRYLNDEMGRLGKPDTSIPYLRLRTRIESLRDDRRFKFMFGEATNDTLPELVGRLLRLPVRGKPLTIVDLSGVPSEAADVVVSLSCRIIFDFTVWSERGSIPPILLVAEEAHRYIPADTHEGFAATARAVTRIAKEGRKYGLSLALISQRPSELATDALSQCGTVFAMRMGNDVDQSFVSRTLPEGARGLLAALPSMQSQEAIVSGEGVPLPMRIRFDDLPPGRRPRSEGAEFSKAWQTDSAGEGVRDEGVRRWRRQSRSSGAL